MEMTVSEIQRNWLGSKNKVEQITILADLNDCTRVQIAKYLYELKVRNDRPNEVFRFNGVVMTYPEYVHAYLGRLLGYEQRGTKKENDIVFDLPQNRVCVHHKNKTEYRIEFAERFHRAILASNKTKKEIAEEIGSNPSYINNIEHGRCMPTLEYLPALVKALGTSCDYLVMGIDMEEVVEDGEGTDT